jgi:hypothetical protein
MLSHQSNGLHHLLDIHHVEEWQVQELFQLQLTLLYLLVMQ